MKKMKKEKLLPEPTGPRISRLFFDSRGKQTALRDGDEISFSHNPNGFWEIEFGRPEPNGMSVISIMDEKKHRERIRLRTSGKEDTEAIAKIIAASSNLDIALYLDMNIGEIRVYKFLKRKK